MAVGYRSILRLDDREDAIRVAKEQFRSWLMEMVRDSRKTVEKADWDGPGTYQLGPDSVLTVIEQGEGNLARLLLEYVETNGDGVWTTRLYATSAPGSRRLKQVTTRTATSPRSKLQPTATRWATSPSPVARGSGCGCSSTRLMDLGCSSVRSAGRRRSSTGHRPARQGPCVTPCDPRCEAAERGVPLIDAWDIGVPD